MGWLRRRLLPTPSWGDCEPADRDPLVTRAHAPVPSLASRAASLATVPGREVSHGRLACQVPSTLTMTLALVALTAACTAGVQQPKAAAPVRGHLVAQLSGSELRFGASPTAVAGVVYQPDVVVIQGGAAAVREVSGSGMTWTIDANAPGASELAVGKIMLATSFGTGRILKLTKNGGDDVVVLGPVSITDLIRDADLGTSAPIPIGNALAYTTPSAPGAAVDDVRDPLAPTTESGLAHHTAARSPTSASGTVAFVGTRESADRVTGLFAPVSGAKAEGSGASILPPPSATPDAVGAGDFQVTPLCCAGGVGVHVGYDKGDGRLGATLTLKMDQPTVSFRLEVSHGKLLEATVQVHGAGGVEVAIDAATRSSAGDFRGKRVHVPETLTIPLAGFGVPLVLSLNQDFSASMQLTGESSFHTKGGYRVSGDLGFGYRNGSPSVIGTALAVEDPMTANTRVLGLASGVITLGWSLKVSIGVGVLGFSAGVWYSLDVGLTVVADGLSLTAGCVRDALLVAGRYGVGWTVPQAVVAVLNFFLQAVHADTITASGGLAWGPNELWRPTPGNFCRKTPS